MNERYVLGEGFGLGKGILNDGPNKGAFAWIGLTADRDGVVACPLRFPNTRAVVGCKCAEPRTRRKFRLVLEVIEEAPEPMTDDDFERLEEHRGESRDERLGGPQ